MRSSQGRLKVLFLPAWYPSEINPIAGIFIKEHAKAASLYNNIVVLYAYLDPSPQPKVLYRVSEDVEDGIRTIRVRYGGLPSYLKRLVFKSKKEVKYPAPSADSGKTDVLKRLLGIPLIIAGDLLCYWSIFTTFRKLRKEGWKPDIIHAHVYSAGVPAVLLAKRYGIPVIISEHFTGFRRGLIHGLGKIKVKFAFEHATLVCPVSKALREDIEAYGVRAQFHVVPNVVDTELFSLGESSNYARGHQEKKQILFVAGLDPKKGVSYLLRALGQLSERRDDFELDIVGEGPYRGEYEELARKQNVADIIHFHGQVTKRTVADFMRKCSFFVLPSLFETFGVVLIEAMACGKPVIATGIGGPNEIVTDEVGKLVPAGNSQALVEAIDCMLDHYQDYSPERIAQYARERFGYETVGRMLSEVYDEVAIDFARQCRKRRKWRVGHSGHSLEIKAEWQVLDIGSGHNPHPRADVLVDKEVGESIHRSGKLARIDKRRHFIVAEACSLPFKDKAFDYVLALHIAEHMDNPKAFCRELMRVSKQGYIETPGKLCERLLGEPFHKHFVYKNGSVLVFERKRKPTGIKWFYRLFYYGQERVGHPSITVSNNGAHLFLKAVNYLMLRLWYLKPIRRWMYTCFEWEQSFDSKVND